MTSKTPVVTTEWYDGAAWQPLTQIDSLEINIPSIATGISNFRIVYNDKRGRISKDIFAPDALTGMGSKFRVKKDAVDLFYGRLYKIIPSDETKRQLVTLFGLGFDRELNTRKTQRTFYGRANVVTNLATMLADINTKSTLRDISTTVSAYNNLNTSSTELLIAQNGKGISPLDYIRECSDTWFLDAHTKYNLNSGVGDGGRVFWGRVTDIASVAALQTSVVFKKVFWANDNNVLTVSTVRDAEDIRNVIKMNLPQAPFFDTLTESLKGWSAVNAATTDVTLQPPSPSGIKGYSKQSVRAAANAYGVTDTGMYLTLSAAMGNEFTTLDLLAYDVLVIEFDYQNSLIGTQNVFIRLRDSADNEIQANLPSAPLVWAIGTTLGIGNGFIGAGNTWQFVSPAVSFDWKIKRIQFSNTGLVTGVPPDSGGFTAVAVDNLRFFPLKTSIVVFDSTSIAQFGRADLEIDPKIFTGAQDLSDYADGLLAAFKDPQLQVNIKTTLDPAISGNLLYPLQGVKLNTPDYKFNGDKWFRITNIKYSLNKSGFYTYYTLVPAEAIV